MNNNKITSAAAILISMNSFAFAGDSGIGQHYFSPMIGYVISDGDRAADDGVLLQLGIGQIISQSWNIELNVTADELDLETGGGEYQQQGAGLDGLYFFKRDARFAPYGLIGAGGLRTEVGGNMNTGVMANVGAGVMSRLGERSMALRFEVRHRWNEDQESVAAESGFSDWIINAGLTMPFGGAVAARTTPADADGDGVADPGDRCPGTVAGAKVDVHGCEPAVADNDGDGVADGSDRCPGTPKGAKVQADGCEADSDGDGVADGKDRCPGTPAGVAVDTTGCERDSDGDGVVDRSDACPDTPRGNVVDGRGCIVIAERVTLKGVTFETNSPKLTGKSRPVLDDMAATLTQHAHLRIEVAGYTDSTGSVEHNVTLSQQRAEAVRQYLIDRGVAADRLVAKGYGPADPVADNTTPAGRTENRRVELRVVGK